MVSDTNVLRRGVPVCRVQDGTSLTNPPLVQVARLTRRAPRRDRTSPPRDWSLAGPPRDRRSPPRDALQVA